MTTTTFAYRNSLEGVWLRYTELLSRTREGPALPDAVRVFASRTGRTWAGVAGITGAALMAITACVTAGAVPLVQVSPSTFLFLSWPALCAAYAAGRVLGAHRMRRETSPLETGDLHTDLARLEKARSVAEARGLATRMERASVALPMIAVALLAPLTLHGAFCALTGIGKGQRFDDWIRVSLLIVGHAHLALAYVYWRFARDASRRASHQLVQQGSRMGWSAYGVAVGVAALPGALFFLIPPVLTALTGLVFNPLLFWITTHWIVAERRALS